MASGVQRFQQLGFNGDLRLVLLQFGTIDQEGIFHTLAQCGDLGKLQVDAMAGQDPRNQVCLLYTSDAADE